jgi:hypothetical protein
MNEKYFCMKCDYHYDRGPMGKYERGCRRGSDPCPEMEKQKEAIAEARASGFEAGRYSAFKTWGSGKP